MSGIFDTLDTCDSKIAQLEASLTEAKSRRDILAKDTIGGSVRGQTAIYLHEKFCPACGRSDDCSFYYEEKNGTHDWKRNEHKRWLYKADELLKILDSETLKKVVQIIKKS